MSSMLLAPWMTDMTDNKSSAFVWPLEHTICGKRSNNMATELKQKKQERDARIQSEAAAAASKADAEKSVFEKAISARAQAYEAEYDAVSLLSERNLF